MGKWNFLLLLLVVSVCAKKGGKGGKGGKSKSPVNCVGEWEGWGRCSKTCGGGTRWRNYDVKTKAKDGGTACSFKDKARQSERCYTSPCPQPVDCEGGYSPPTPCSKTCGGGVQTRTYTITQQPLNGGRRCSVSEGNVVRINCGTQRCPVKRDCVGSWGACSACDADCNGGKCTRTYTVTQSESGGGSACPTRNGATKVEDCNKDPCPVVVPPVVLCKEDIVLVLDASGSVSNEDFETSKKWAMTFIEGKKSLMAVKATRISAVVFGNNAQVLSIPTFNSDVVKFQISKYFRPARYWTYSDVALMSARALLSMNKEPGWKKVIIMLTDGEPKSSSGSRMTQTQREVANCKASNVVTTAVGVGRGVSKTQLAKISTLGQAGVFQAEKFSELDGLAQKLASKSCFYSDASPVDCVGGWGGWGDCCSGSQARTYKVTTESVGGKECGVADGQTETRPCSPNTCPPTGGDCEGRWGAWGVCCSGKKRRAYTVTKAAWGTGTPCPEKTGNTMVQSCSPDTCVAACKEEILMIIDESGSIKDRDFKKTVQWAARFIEGKKTALDQGTTRIGAVRLGTILGANANIITLSTTNYGTLMTKVGGYKRPSQPQWTYTDRAVETTLRSFKTDDEWRKVIIMLTDGAPYGQSPNQDRMERAQREVAKATPLGIDIFVVGVGSGVKMSMLEKLSTLGEPGVHFVRSFDSLNDVADKLSKKSCWFATTNKQDCVGGWSNWGPCCAGKSVKTYKITTKAIGGTKCPFSDGDKESKTCSGTASNCPAPPGGGKICSQNKFESATGGQITDGPGDYGSDWDCRTTISCPAGQLVSVEFTELCTEDDYDFVILYDGAGPMSDQLKEFSGCKKKMPDAVVSTGNTMYVKFTSDTETHDKGFILNYKCKAKASPAVNCAGGWGPFGTCSTTCGNGLLKRQYLITTQASGGGKACPYPAGFSNLKQCSQPACVPRGSGSICTGESKLVGVLDGYVNHGPDPNANYKPNMDCKKLITCPSNKVVKVTFTKFCTQKNKDIMTLYDGDSTGKRVLQKHSGCSKPSEETTTQRNLLAHFKSGRSWETKGFHMVYSCVTPKPPKINCKGKWDSKWSACSKSCGGGTRTRAFTVTTPASGGGRDCSSQDGKLQLSDCNKNRCPVLCEVTDTRAGPCGADSCNCNTEDQCDAQTKCKWTPDGCKLKTEGSKCATCHRRLTTGVCSTTDQGACKKVKDCKWTRGVCATILRGYHCDCEGAWGTYTTCSKTCGGGIEKREYKITQTAAVCS
eukprot:NODE_12_length_4287_cov_46.545540_g8_i0.p1 GENE.NODE_12_length_4287_cov_46.545540_g8_i0~~NODE_12_length_4287_cov_46.545540_g8_i0.p1  ORF type:complete len:1262 (+),score=238.62 NODE_12_length_4287_cov_46.545540_g8_i0:81-3866(+)